MLQGLETLHLFYLDGWWQQDFMVRSCSSFVFLNVFITWIFLSLPWLTLFAQVTMITLSWTYAWHDRFKMSFLGWIQDLWDHGTSNTCNFLFKLSYEMFSAFVTKADHTDCYPNHEVRGCDIDDVYHLITACQQKPEKLIFSTNLWILHEFISITKNSHMMEFMMIEWGKYGMLELFISSTLLTPVFYPHPAFVLSISWIKSTVNSEKVTVKTKSMFAFMYVMNLSPLKSNAVVSTSKRWVFIEMKYQWLVHVLDISLITENAFWATCRIINEKKIMFYCNQSIPSKLLFPSSIKYFLIML